MNKNVPLDNILKVLNDASILRDASPQLWTTVLTWHDIECLYEAAKRYAEQPHVQPYEEPTPITKYTSRRLDPDL